MPVNDPELVRDQYEREDNLRARQALYEEKEGPDAREAVWEALAELAPRRVLEVGGGPGELAERMQRELGAEVRFVDTSPRMVELARTRGVEAQVGDVQALPFGDESFDAVVAAWMLYHVPDLDRALAEIERVVAPGGALVAVTNSADHLRELRELISYRGGFESTFSRENGEEHLRRHFARVEQRDIDATVIVRDRAKLVAYRDSLSLGAGEVPKDMELPFVMHARSSVFVARK
ncbi:MAG TPA: class I SAM-dependent methyltransferase [Gaiellaceae bacterium]|nr:class I SAM-dependent methyltransferase [Gaiellaceae bacterium]